MNRQKLLRALNPLLLLSLAVQAGTAALIIFGKKAPFSLDLFELHERNGVLLIALAVAHLALNWGWVRANYLKG